MQDANPAIDLNLLIALDVLLRERNVTRAARRLGLSQPGASSALARLRKYYGDELLLRTGNTYELTALGAQLLGQTGSAVAGVRRVFNSTISFDAATSTREFRLVVSDYTAMLLGELVLPRLREEAPLAQLHLDQAAQGAIVSGGRDELSNVDAAVLGRGAFSSPGGIELFRDEWVCIVAADGPERVRREDVDAVPWVLSFDRATGVTQGAMILDAEGLHPTAAVIVEDLLSVPFIVQSIQGVAFVPRRLAERVGPGTGVRIIDAPVPTPQIRMELWHHPVLDHDPGSRWLRQFVVSATRELRPDDSAELPESSEPLEMSPLGELDGLNGLDETD